MPFYVGVFLSCALYDAHARIIMHMRVLSCTCAGYDAHWRVGVLPPVSLSLGKAHEKAQKRLHHRHRRVPKFLFNRHLHVF